MKIFAKQLALVFTHRKDGQNYEFSLRREGNLSNLLREPPSFAGQVKYIAVRDAPDRVAQILFEALPEQAEGAPYREFHLVFPELAPAEAAVKAFRAHFKEVVAAGGLVFAPDGRLLVIHRLGFWDLPKGKTESGESIRETARREVAEETGAEGLEIVGPLRPTHHCYPRKDRWEFKTTHWYEMTLPRAQSLVPETEESIERAEWVAADEWLERAPGAYPLIQELMQEYLQKKAGLRDAAEGA